VLGDFKILVLIHDGESKSYLARHPAYDRTIMLHILPKGETAEYAELAGALERLPPESRRLILDRGEQDGASYVVTERILDFQSLPGWLEKVAPAAPAPAQAPASPGGEFTRLFQTTPVVAPSAAPSVPPEPPKRLPAQAPPGEFTRLFSGVGTGTRDPAPIPSTPKKPGAFTKAFLALSDTEPEPPPVAPPSPAVAPPKAGDFTRFFESPLAPAPDPLQARPAPQVQPEPVNPPKPVVQSASEFTRMFGTPFPESPAEPAPPSAPVPPPPAPMAVPAMPSMPPAPVPAMPQPAAVPKAGPSNTVLIVIVVVLVLLAAGLIVFFVLKH
jgi:hypothetical protein